MADDSRVPSSAPPAPPAADWCSTDLTGRDALVLELGPSGKAASFPVVQFVASFAMNEIPTATCVVAVGRLASGDGTEASPAHALLGEVRNLEEARVYMRPTGFAAPFAEWPGDAQLVFDGRYTGCGFRSAGGQVHLVLHLVHWLVDLTFSSTLSADSHVSNPSRLADPAAFRPVASGAGGPGRPAYLPEYVGFDVLKDSLKTDLWTGVHELLTTLAQRKRLELGCSGGCGTRMSDNSLALGALKYVEASTELAAAPGPYYKPLALDTGGVDKVESSVVEAIQRQALDAYAHMTFWDAMVNAVFPMFSMAIVPRVETAVVVADCPSFRRAYKTIDSGEYDSFDLSGALSRPLSAVGVFGSYESLAGAAGGGGAEECLSGCFAPEGSDAAVGGVALYVSAPVWLEGTSSVDPPTGEAPVATATTPETATAGSSDPLDVTRLYNAYAQSVFAAHALKGRVGNVSGRLRFDVSPGSIVRLKTRPEKFLAGSDGLAVDLFGSVSRVTVAVNTESGQASTAYQLTHLRTAAENGDDRTSSGGHPLFGSNVFNGAPLVDAWAEV